MAIKPITLEYFYNRGKNVYEAIVVASRRARRPPTRSSTWLPESAREWIDSASIEVNRRARRQKTDRLDAEKLLSMLLREALGEANL